MTRLVKVALLLVAGIGILLQCVNAGGGGGGSKKRKQVGGRGGGHGEGIHKKAATMDAHEAAMHAADAIIEHGDFKLYDTFANFKKHFPIKVEEQLNTQHEQHHQLISTGAKKNKYAGDINAMQWFIRIELGRVALEFAKESTKLFAYQRENKGKQKKGVDLNTVPGLLKAYVFDQLKQKLADPKLRAEIKATFKKMYKNEHESGHQSAAMKKFHSIIDELTKKMKEEHERNKGRRGEKEKMKDGGGDKPSSVTDKQKHEAGGGGEGAAKMEEESQSDRDGPAAKKTRRSRNKKGRGSSRSEKGGDKIASTGQSKRGKTKHRENMLKADKMGEASVSDPGQLGRKEQKTARIQQQKEIEPKIGENSADQQEEMMAEGKEGNEEGQEEGEDDPFKTPNKQIVGSSDGFGQAPHAPKRMRSKVSGDGAVMQGEGTGSDPMEVDEAEDGEATQTGTNSGKPLARKLVDDYDTQLDTTGEEQEAEPMIKTEDGEVAEDENENRIVSSSADTSALFPVKKEENDDGANVGARTGQSG